MKTSWIMGFLILAVGMRHCADAHPPNDGGFLSNLFRPRFNIPEFPGQKTESVLPPLVKEHHEHVWVEKPHYDVQKTETFGNQQKQVVHNHVTHQKVVHEDHKHKHVLNEHTQHNVRTHNTHNLVEHVHEHTKEQEHVHKPIYHEYQHHQHKVTNEHVTKHTEGKTVKHTHEQQVTSVQNKPIYQKEWSFLGWLRAWSHGLRAGW